MARINIIILTVLFSSFCCKAQSFSLFDEDPYNTSIFLTPKGVTRPVLEGDQLYEFRYPYVIDNIRKKAVIFFRIFEPLTSSERDIMRRVCAEIFFTSELKMSYYNICIPGEYRSFFLVREQKLVQWLEESFSDMSKDRKEFNIAHPDKFVGGRFMVWGRGFYIHASDLLKK
ncbi:MAG: hypothetical protein LUH63_12295 [Parabacteroides sp.]|nr:hypothetical protein [Parabacteroides sp.]